MTDFLENWLSKNKYLEMINLNKTALHLKLLTSWQKVKRLTHVIIVQSNQKKNYMKSKFEEYGKVLYKYYEKINNELGEKLKKQYSDVFKTNRGNYEIIKIEKIILDELKIENEKFHNLFSEKGCKISGTMFVKAQAYEPNAEKNYYKSHFFEIRFAPTIIKFNFEDEIFYTEEDININYIYENDDLRIRLI